MEHKLVDVLLHDARMVLEYAVRVGRLPDGSLPAAISSVEASVANGTSPDLVALSSALNSAVAAIAPVTLIDMLAGRSPFDRARRASTTVLQFALAMLAVVLAGLIGFYSFSVHRAENLVREYRELEEANVSEKIAALQVLAGEDAFASGDARKDLYRSMHKELKSLHQRTETNFIAFHELKRAPAWPLQDELIQAWERFQKHDGGTSARGISGAVNQVTQGHPSGTEAPPGFASTSLSEEFKSFCENVEKPVQPDSYLTKVKSDNRNWYCFAQTLGVENVQNQVLTIAGLVPSVQERIFVQSIWVLPFLSGLLGAAIFLVRDSLDPLTASFGATRAVVRLAIGGVAGIIIGWFWAPNSAVDTGVYNASSIPLALAFVTGYSIDILYTALETLKRSFTSSRPAKSPG